MGTEGSERLNRGTGVPLWQQLAMQMREAIGEGEFPRGAQLASEHELARRYGVNRHTVRQAVRALAEEGLVRAERGRGTFVADVIVNYPLSGRTRFGANLLSQERMPTREIIAVEAGVEDAGMARRLELAPATPLAWIRSRGLADGVPIAVGETWVESGRFPDIRARLKRDPSITRLFEVHGIAEYRRRVTRVLARLPDPEEASLLRQVAIQPVLVTEALDVDAAGRPLSWARTLWAGERVHFTVEG
jgi:GntR family phosphonate transport system transcriptional regulator